MNYLGHLYFSNNNAQLMYANLFGDFVKGKNLSKYPKLIETGILLHREIDSYIDNHPVVRDLLHQLYPILPKISGIAVDLYFDHLLSRNWKSYHHLPYNQFLQQFYDAEIENKNEYSIEFINFISILKEKNWMLHYPTHDGLNRVCKGLSNRISFPNSLGQAPGVYSENEALIETAFTLFMKDAMVHFREFHSKISY